MKNNRGQGMIGLLLTVLIIGILASFMLRSYRGKKTPGVPGGDAQDSGVPVRAIKRAHGAMAIAEIQSIRDAMEIFKVDHEGALPSSLDDLVSGGYLSPGAIHNENGTTYHYDPATGQVTP